MSHTEVRQLISALILLCCPLCLLSQTTMDQMSADRPGFGNSTELVGRGVIQIETGLRVFHEREAGDRNGILTEPQIRFGVARWLELRLSSERILLRAPQDPGELDRAVGVSDLQTGVKFPLLSTPNGTSLSAIVETSLPTGHSSQTSNGFSPGAELIWQQDISHNLSLAGTWNLSRNYAPESYWQRAAALSFSGDFTRKLRGLVEVYVVSPLEAGAGNRWMVDGGFMRSLGSDATFDATAGWTAHGLRSWFVVLGISRRAKVGH